MDSLFELDKWIEEHVYSRFEPCDDAYPPFYLGWSKEEDGRYSYWDYSKNRSYYVSEIWPRRFSTNTMLSVDLAKKFRISIKPVVNLSDVVIGYEVESSLRPCVIVVQETLEEAIYLLVVMITKNTEVKDV